jgi:uncharacterized protein
MAKFKITAYHPLKNDTRYLNYDNSTSQLTWEDGSPVIPSVQKYEKPNEQVKIHKGKRNLKTIKIQLGLSCNFECDYCNQRFVPHADSTNPDDVTPFVENMSTWYPGGEDGLGGGSYFEFWGGEPLVYWKTMKPLAEAIKEKYPNSSFSVITNGSLLDEEKNEWLETLGFSVSVSHDGPGQFVRGPDPLEDEKSKIGIIDLYKRLAPKQKFSFNSMINSKNISRVDIESFFTKFVVNEIGAEYLKYLGIGEGTFVDAYDEGGLANSLLDEEEDIKFRNESLNDLRSGNAMKFGTIHQKVSGFIQSIENQIPKEMLTQKCGMDKEENIAIDLNGNVLTCQNVSPVSVNPSGISHHIGHVSNLEAVEVKTGTHWSDRSECPSCPVLHICKGACFFLTGELWEASCNNAFSDNITVFALTIETITDGYIPGYIDGPLREDRKDIFWWQNGKPEKTRKAKKIIPIVAV